MYVRVDVIVVCRISVRSFVCRCRGARGNNSVSWYAAAIQPQRYALAKDNLVRSGFDVYDPFAPVYCNGVRGGKNVRVFPGYMFIQCTDIPWQRANRTVGVVGLLPLRRDAIALPTALVERIAGYVRERLYADDIALRIGDAVVINSGVFSGWRGQVTKLHNRSIVVELMLFGRNTCVDVPYAHCERVNA